MHMDRKRFYTVDLSVSIPDGECKGKNRTCAGAHSAELCNTMELVLCIKLGSRVKSGVLEQH